MFEWFDRVRRRRRWRKSKSSSRAAATRLWGVTEDGERAEVTAHAESATTWSIASSVVLVALVFVLRLPLLATGLSLLVGGFTLLIGSNLFAARVGRSATTLLRALAVVAMAAYVAGAVVLCIAGGLCFWRGS